ncbi:MAG: flagellar basal body L-ring protein FlgH [Candidatus Acidiferrales bacterium]
MRRAPEQWLTRLRLAAAMGCAAAILLSAGSVDAKGKNKRPKTDALNGYIAQFQPERAYVATTGSLWNPTGRLSDVASDAKARYAGDQMTIQLVESTTSALQGSVQTSRSLAASSSIGAFFGKIGGGSAAQNIFSPNSSQALTGKGQTALATSLDTTLAANVTRVLPNGLLVIEARREVEVSEQRQTMVLRGIVRPQDISPNDVVLSTSISHLEVTLDGKGVLTESTRQPGLIVRTLLHFFNF